MLRLSKVLTFSSLLISQASCLESNTKFHDQKIDGTTISFDEQSEDAVPVPNRFEATDELGNFERFDACKHLELQTQTAVLQFPATESCMFGKGDNLVEKDGFLQAMVSQTAEINLRGRKTILCDLKMATISPELQYDDFIVLTLNDHILMSSNEDILDFLDFNTTYQWNFKKARGNELDFDAEPYCFGNDSSICEIPKTDTFGKLKLGFNAEVLATLSAQLTDSKTLAFQLIATGDNDPDDCLHSDFALQYELSYVKY